MVFSFANKKILITGGAGFIGSRLVDELSQQKAHVFVADISIDPHSYFAKSQLEKKCTYLNLDVLREKELYRAITDNKIEYIFHLAAQTLVTEAYKNPYDTLKVNIMGTVNILEAARAFPFIKGIIVASSDKAYGKTKETYTEESPLKGDHPYDVSKSSADLIAQAYFKTYRVPVVITRFGNVYGEGDLHMDRIIPGICEAIIKKNILEIRSDGTYVRDYLYVKDVANGYLVLLQNIEKIKGQAYNFSSQDCLSVLNLVRKTENILHCRIPYKILNNAKNEIPYQHLDDSKVKKLGWRSKYNLENMLTTVFKWYKNNV